MDNNKFGYVRYIGSINEYTINYGIELMGINGNTNDNSINYDSILNKYPNIGLSKNSRIFVDKIKIKKILNNENRAQYTLNDNIYCRQVNCIGIIKYVGHLMLNDVIYYGIELKDSKGTCNGDYNGYNYFYCNNNCGIFCVESDVIDISDQKDEQFINDLANEIFFEQNYLKDLNIYEACLNGCYNIVHKILNNSSLCINDKNNDGNSPIHLATQMGFKDIVSLLLKFKCDVNILNSDGLTPLYVATQKGFNDIIQILIQNNANPNLGIKKNILYICIIYFLYYPN